MNLDHRDLDVSILADWLADKAGDRFWTVDGEYEIGGMANLPCLGRDLAETLKKVESGRRIRIFAPPGSTVSPDADLAEMAEKDDDGALEFEVAWLSDGVSGERWVLVQDTLAEEAERTAEEAERLAGTLS